MQNVANLILIFFSLFLAQSEKQKESWESINFAPRVSGDRFLIFLYVAVYV